MHLDIDLWSCYNMSPVLKNGQKTQSQYRRTTMNTLAKEVASFITREDGKKGFLVQIANKKKFFEVDPNNENVFTSKKEALAEIQALLDKQKPAPATNVIVTPKTPKVVTVAKVLAQDVAKFITRQKDGKKGFLVPIGEKQKFFEVNPNSDEAFSSKKEALVEIQALLDKQKPAHAAPKEPRVATDKKSKWTPVADKFWRVVYTDGKIQWWAIAGEKRLSRFVGRASEKDVFLFLTGEVIESYDKVQFTVSEDELPVSKAEIVKALKVSAKQVQFV